LAEELRQPVKQLNGAKRLPANERSAGCAAAKMSAVRKSAKLRGI